MARRVIEGRDVLLRAELNGDYVPFVCATSFSYYHETEMIRRTTVSSGNFRQWKPRLSEWGMELNSVSVAAPETPAYNVFDTLLESIRMNGLNVEASFKDGDGNIKTIVGFVWLPSTEINSPAVGFSEDVIKFLGDGIPTLGETLVTPIDELDEPQIVTPVIPEGETEGNVPQLIGKTAEDVIFERDGIGKEVITAGVPNDKEVLIDFATGDVTLPYPKQPGEWIQILLI